MPADISRKVDEFFARYKPQRCAKRQVLILNGDDSEYVYYLLEGSVKVYDVTRRGDEIILNIFRPPAFFPMSLAINGGTSPYIYEAETELRFRQAPANEVVEFIKANPDVLFDLLSRVYRGIDGVLGRMAHLMSGSAKSRLIYELLLEAKRSGYAREDGSCDLAASAKDLGARAGLTRETVSREVQKLKAEGLVEIRSRHMVVKDMDALERKLGTEI